MKRDILCEDCGVKFKKTFKDYVPDPLDGPEDFVGFKDGRALRAFRCDTCFAEIAPDQNCVAMSIWTAKYPYTKWEDDYIYKRPEEKGKQ